jgi:hypothetical protein
MLEAKFTDKQPAHKPYEHNNGYQCYGPLNQPTPTFGKSLGTRSELRKLSFKAILSIIFLCGREFVYFSLVVID